MTDIVITKISINEIGKLQEISRRTFFETFSADNTEVDMKKYLEEGLSVEKLTSELNDPCSEFYFATLDNSVIGYLKINFGQSQTELKGNQSLEIERIYVLKEFQGKKVGQLLFDKAIGIARQKNFDYIWLGVWEKNLRALRFYQRNGFVEFDKHIFKLGNDEQTDIMMKLTLNDQDKTKEELIKELLELKQNHDELKVSFEKDIDGRKQVEKALLESEKNFRNMADAAKVVISIVADTKGAKFLYVNDEWSRVQGYSKEEALNLRPIDLVAPECRQLILDRAIKRIEGKSVPYSYELKTITKSGEIKYFDFSPTIINFENQKAFLTTSIDLTERRRAEEKLREKEVILRELNAQKDKFFSIIAHDLKSPFNTIMGFSELLMEQINEKDYNGVDEYAKMIMESSKQALDLLMNLLEWSRVQTGRMQFSPENFDLVHLVDENILLFDLIAAQKAITINKSLPHEFIIFADKQMIRTVLRNLISNAIKFTRQGGEINISAEKTAKEVHISVSDNGIGIAPERIEKLFRIDESNSTYGTNDEAGTGLGLILCKEFVEKHGGRIWVESEQEKGSTFYVSLKERHTK